MRKSQTRARARTFQGAPVKNCHVCVCVFSVCVCLFVCVCVCVYLCVFCVCVCMFVQVHPGQINCTACPSNETCLSLLMCVCLFLCLCLCVFICAGAGAARLSRDMSAPLLMQPPQARPSLPLQPHRLVQSTSAELL